MNIDKKNKYINEIQTIYFKKNYVLLKIGNSYKNIIFITEIDYIFFNIDKNGYYFRVIAKGSNQYQFDFKFNTKYRIKNKNNLRQKIKNKKIKLIPNFAENTTIGNGCIEYCEMKKKYFLTITTIRSEFDKKELFINYGNIDREFYKTTNYDLTKFDLEKELLSDKRDLKKQTMHNGFQGVCILDKSLTFGMGYAITATEMGIGHSIDNYELIDYIKKFSIDVFYSFNEEKIKDKIKELLSSSYKIQNIFL